MINHFDELQEAKIYIQQLEEENKRLLLSQKALRNNNRALLEGNNKLRQHVQRLRKERDEWENSMHEMCVNERDISEEE